MAKIYHADLYGLREDKYQTLSENTINSTEFKQVNPQSEFYLFIPQNTHLFGEYEQYLKITDIMPINGVGMTTARDHVVIDFEKQPILERATFFRDSNELDEEVCHQLNIPLKKGWNLQKARELIKQEDNLEQHIKPVLYRPFDNRYIFYHDSLVWRTVKKIMKNMLLGDNLGLVTVRQVAEGIFNHVFPTNNIIESRITISNKGIGFLFPLYIYPDTEKPQELQQEKWANFSSEFLNKIESKLGYLPTPEAIFYYIYAVFHSPTYRSRYAEFLKIDFPRLPLTSNNQLFTDLSAIGEQLVQLHLMTSATLTPNPSPTRGGEIEFVENGGNREANIASAKTAWDNGVVKLNSQDYFTGVTQEVWNFYIGGYQVCHKWLKDRKGRILSDDDILHYQNIVIALSETIKLMTLIDETIPSFPME